MSAQQVRTLLSSIAAAAIQLAGEGVPLNEDPHPEMVDDKVVGMLAEIDNDLWNLLEYVRDTSDGGDR